MPLIKIAQENANILISNSSHDIFGNEQCEHGNIIVVSNGYQKRSLVCVSRFRNYLKAYLVRRTR